MRGDPEIPIARNDKGCGREKIASNRWYLFILVLPALWMFRSVILADQTFSFRDAPRFYYPCMEWVTNEWKEFRVPSWQPDENTGIPLVGDTTPSVFYPGLLLLILPIRPSSRVNVFVVLHVLLAAVNTYVLTRKWRFPRAAGAVSALIYAYSAPVVFNYSNQVFLVSAAWLPLGILAANQCRKARTAKSACSVGAVMAIMVIGGDPHTAYNLGLTAAFGIMFFGQRPTSISSHVLQTSRQLVWIALTAFLLAAIQILPSWEWGRNSERASFRSPRSLYEFLYKLPDTAPRTLGQFESPDTHQQNVYDFSVAPWRVVELACPNVLGTAFPVNRRWSSAIGNEGRIWTPSLYIGISACVLCCGALRFCRGTRRRRWITWTVALALLASLGGFGIGWACQLVGFDFGIARATGGLYWWLVTLLPGYVYFRYPAKWLVWVSMGMSLLAGMCLRTNTASVRRFVSRACLIVVVLGILGIVAVQVTWPQLATGLSSRIAPDLITGPLDSTGALAATQLGFLQMSLVSFVLFLAFSRSNSSESRNWRIAALIAFDLAIANGWFVTTTSNQLLERQSAVAKVLVARSDETKSAPPLNAPPLNAPPLDGPIRVYRSPSTFALPIWSRQASEHRLAESLSADLDTLFLRLPWRRAEQLRIASIESHGSIWNEDYRSMLRLSRRFRTKSHSDRQQQQGTVLPDLNTLRLIGTQFILAPNHETALDVDELQHVASFKINFQSELVLQQDEEPTTGVRQQWSLWALKNSIPRVRIVRDVDVMAPIDRELHLIEQRTADVLFPGGRPRDFQSTAVIETHADSVRGLAMRPATKGSNSHAGRPQQLLLSPEVAEASRADYCHITSETPTEVRIEAYLDEEGLLVLSDLYAEGWEAWVAIGADSIQQVPIYRTNRVQRGVFLSRGAQQVRFVYRPKLLNWGIWTSGVAGTIYFLTCGFSYFASMGRRRKH